MNRLIVCSLAVLVLVTWITVAYEHLSQIFDPFYLIPCGAPLGWGIGMFLASLVLAASHRGTIRLTKSLLVGCFLLTGGILAWNMHIFCVNDRGNLHMSWNNITRALIFGGTYSAPAILGGIIGLKKVGLKKVSWGLKKVSG